MVKDFPVQCYLTLLSGISCVKEFGLFHEFMEHVLGHPVWTHEFHEAMDIAITKVPPELAEELAEVVTLLKNPETRVATMHDVVVPMTRMIPTPRGTDVRTIDPITTLKEKLC